MSDDAKDPAPSLLLARHENAHREHQHQLHEHEHRHLHHNIHNKRQAGTTVQEVQSVVTEVLATVSYLQQIDVDGTGSTFSVETVLASPTPSLTDNSAPATTTPASQSAYTSGASSNNSTQSASSASASQSLQSSQQASSALTSTPSGQPTNFPTSVARSNSTSLITSSSSLSAATFSTFSNTFSNSTTSSTSSSSSSSSSSFSSSLTSLTSSSSSSTSSSSSSSTSSTSSSYSPSSSSYQPTSTGAGGIGAGGTGASSGGSPTSTAAAGNGSGSGSGASSVTPKVLGGVLGGLAGLALLAVLILFLLKRWRQKQQMISLGTGNEGSINDQVRDVPPSQPPSGMVQRRSLAFAVPAALASLTGYNKRASQKTTGTVSSTAGSEQGFYRVSGRKLPSVLHTGGDGYGGDGNTMSGSSFYRDSTGFYGGPGSPPPTSSPLGPERDSGVPVMRPSPARTPVTEHGPFRRSATPPPPPPLTPLTPPHRPDLLGRSHPSQDGSHASRFTEEV